MAADPEETGERVEWVTSQVFEYEDDGNTRKYVANGLPGDPVLRGVIALVDEFGAWYDPVLSPETAVQMVELILDAALIAERTTTTAEKS